MKYLPDEEHLPYGPETVGVSCDNCGESFMTDEMSAAHAAEHGDDLLCDECRREEQRDRLIRALVDGDDDVFSRSSAAMYLRHDHPDTFPIHDPENDRWILDVERDSLDERGFVGRWVEVTTGNDPCPDCGDDRRRYASFDNGIIGGFRESCTICERIHSEDAG